MSSLTTVSKGKNAWIILAVLLAVVVAGPFIVKRMWSTVQPSDGEPAPSAEASSPPESSPPAPSPPASPAQPPVAPAEPPAAPAQPPSPPPEPPQAQPAPVVAAPGVAPALFTEQMGDVQIELVGCQAKSNRVQCNGRMTQAVAGSNYIDGGGATYLADAHGRQFPVSRILLGAEQGSRSVSIEFQPALPVYFELTFENVQNPPQRAALNIQVRDHDFLFRDVPIGR